MFFLLFIWFVKPIRADCTIDQSARNFFFSFFLFVCSFVYFLHFISIYAAFLQLLWKWKWNFYCSNRQNRRSFSREPLREASQCVSFHNGQCFHKVKSLKGSEHLEHFVLTGAPNCYFVSICVFVCLFNNNFFLYQHKFRLSQSIRI